LTRHEVEINVTPNLSGSEITCPAMRMLDTSRFQDADKYAASAEGYCRPDPTQPMSAWRTAWRRLTREAGLGGLRFHDLRHHAITELAEGSASDQVIRSIAGHVSKEMLEHYSHIRLDAKRAALESLSRRGSGGGYVTKNVTNQAPEPPADPQVVEESGGRHGIRTHGLLVANEALSQLS